MLTRLPIDLPTNIGELLRAPPTQEGYPARVAQLEQQTRLQAEEHYRLIQAIQAMWDVLNSNGALEIVANSVTAPETSIARHFMWMGA